MSAVTATRHSGRDLVHVVTSSSWRSGPRRRSWLGCPIASQLSRTGVSDSLTGATEGGENSVSTRPSLRCRRPRGEPPCTPHRPWGCSALGEPCDSRGKRFPHHDADAGYGAIRSGCTVPGQDTRREATAFVKEGFDHLVHHGDDASDLHDEARDVFGFGNWSIGGGVQTSDPSVPASPMGGDKAAQFIGQGQVTASPLVMASVAATVRDGAFHQPVILPDQPQTPAPRQIPATTADYLRHMMRAVATGGTASARLSTLPGVGAKTGTAEEGTGTNGWLTACNDDLAVAALVEGGTSGVDSAGYVVRDMLTAR
ncbi:hypothetical protein KEF29_34730 [Streptomyces tuirus]|uniref:Penicillin-binding protein transpeptidase domain-containing protein n=1 Tax=Streptomyces tuirus TaxID=68278 RepID=A0A941FDN5_9ACTN|nr:hypothetical protein [Streptomyces tuirus]